MKTKEELLEMSVEEMTEYILKQQDIKKTMTEEQATLKNKIGSMSTQLEEFQSKQKEILEAQAEEDKAKLIERVSKLNIKEKFVDDIISKANVNLDMEDKDFNEVISKTLDKYPEYKFTPANVKEEDSGVSGKTYGESYADIIREAKNK